MDRALLESFSRPENLIEHELAKASALLAEHRARLAAVEGALGGGGGGGGADAAGDALLLTLRPADRVDATALVATGDVPFDRTMRVLGALCDEAAFLRDRLGRAAPFLSLFGHSREDDGGDFGEGVLEAMAGKCLPRFVDTANLAARAAALAANATQQIAALFGKGSAFAPAWADVKLRPLFFALGDVLACLVTLDAIVRGNKMVRPRRSPPFHAVGRAPTLPPPPTPLQSPPPFRSPSRGKSSSAWPTSCAPTRPSTAARSSRRRRLTACCWRWTRG